MKTMSAQEMAQACADTMWSNDKASQALGMRIEYIAPSEARLSMVVREDMTNGQAICHGGMIFTLADSAFAFACNGYNQRAVAQQGAITFLAPAFEGDTLSAHAREIVRKGRGGLYDVRISNQDGALIAEFRGHSRTVKGVHLPDQK